MESTLQFDILAKLYDICHTAAHCSLRICVMSVDSSFAIPFQSKYTLLKKSPDVLLKISTSTVPYKKNGKHQTGKVSCAGRKQDKRTAVFFWMLRG